MLFNKLLIQDIKIYIYIYIYVYTHTTPISRKVGTFYQIHYNNQSSVLILLNLHLTDKITKISHFVNTV